jgi:multidrug efflux system outer membrane protein
VRLRPLAALAALCALAAGCALGPNYQRPELAPPQAFRGETAPGDEAFVDLLPWWQIFSDPVLVELTSEALEGNLDLAAAVARVETSEAFVGVVRSELIPQIGYDVEAGRSRTSKNVSFGDGNPRSLFFGALNLAWEIDVWGRIRRATEAARAEMLASEAFRRAVRLSLVAGVAQAYFELRELDRQLEIARRTAEAYVETRDLFQRQFQGGTASRLEVERAEAALAQTQAQIPDFERLIVAKENEISVLLGRAPGEVPRGVALDAQEIPAVPTGLPSQLLERRPDVVLAEETLVASNARVGAALAGFFPRIGLTSLYGRQSESLADLVKKGSGVWSLAGLAAGPIFEGGRNWYLYGASKSERQAALSDYEQSVLRAFQEVSDALVGREKLALARAHQARAVEALQESVRLALVRYRGGLSNYIEVLDAQQDLYPAELLLASYELEEILSLTRLYRALGGGWSIDELPQASPPPAP